MLVGLRPVRGPSAPGCSRRAAQGPEPGDRPQAPTRADVRRDRARNRPFRGRRQDAFQARARGAARRVDREGDRAMTIRDREVLEELHEDPELLALADALVETQRLRRVRPLGALTAVALVAAALFLLVLAAPWDRGAETPLLERALAAVPANGPVAHLTVRIEMTHGQRTFSPVTTESFYDKQQGLVRLISRGDGKVLADYTTVGKEDEFSSFPGLLDGAAFYRQALAGGRARVVGKGVWRGRRVYWLRLNGGGGAGHLRIGIGRNSSQPLVFVGINRDGSPAGFQAEVLGLDYVPTDSAGFQTDAPILVSGRVLGPGCKPVKALVGVSLSEVPTEGRAQLSVDAASTR